MYSMLTRLLFLAFSMLLLIFFFFFNDTATTEIYTLSLHDALPICDRRRARLEHRHRNRVLDRGARHNSVGRVAPRDRKSTRLNSSHLVISYAVFCLKKKKANFAQRRLSRPCARTAYTLSYDEQARH